MQSNLPVNVKVYQGVSKTTTRLCKAYGQTAVPTRHGSEKPGSEFDILNQISEARQSPLSTTVYRLLKGSLDQSPDTPK